MIRQYGDKKTKYTIGRRKNVSTKEEIMNCYSYNHGGESLAVLRILRKHSFSYEKLLRVKLFSLRERQKME